MKMNLMEAFQIRSPLDYGIVRAIYDTHNPLANPPEIPFLPSEEAVERLDNAYYFMWSGDKITSPLIDKMYVESATVHLDKELLAKMFWDIYGAQLMKQWENFVREYDPVNDYDITEEMHYDHSGGSSGTDNNVRSGNVQQTGTSTDTDSAWAYDKSGQNEDRPVSKTVTEISANSPMQTQYNNVTDARTRSGTETADDDLTNHKYGNLGVQPMSLLIKQDIDLWKLNFYRNIFFPALDSFLAIPIY